MTEDPCLKEKQEAERLRLEWEALINPAETPVPSSEFSAEAVQETLPFIAEERERLKEYMAAVRAMHDCLKKHQD